MKPVKSAGLISAIAFTVLAAAACSRSPERASFAPSESCLYITGEGTVTSATIEKYDNDYYSEEELKASVEEALSGFGEGVSLNSVSLSDGTASLLLDFSTPAEYLEFMSRYPDGESKIQVTSMDITDVAAAASGGELSGMSFTAPDGKTVSADDIKKQTKLNVAFVEGPALIQTDGAIQYISEGITVVGTNQIQTAPDGMSCIVFK